MNKNFLLLILFLPILMFGQVNNDDVTIVELEKAQPPKAYKGDYCYSDELIHNSNALKILVNSTNQILINDNYSQLEDIQNKAHQFLLNNTKNINFKENLKNKIIIIESAGFRNFDYEIITIIYNVYKNLGVQASDRKLCYFNHDEDNRYLQISEQPPVFPCITINKKENCGEEGIYVYIKENLIYPPLAEKKNIQGKVYVSFVVDTDGSITNVDIVRGVNELLDTEALRIVSSFPKYKPASNKGKPVKMMLTIPIDFRLN